MVAALEIGQEGRPRATLLKAPCLAPKPVPPLSDGLQAALLPKAGRARRRPRAAEQAPRLPLLSHRPLLPAAPPPPGAGDVFHSLACKFYPAVSPFFLELKTFRRTAPAPGPAPVQKTSSGSEPLEGTVDRGHFCGAAAPPQQAPGSHV